MSAGNRTGGSGAGDHQPVAEIDRVQVQELGVAFAPRARREIGAQAIVKGQQQVMTFNLGDNSYKAPNKASVKLPSDMTMRLTTAEEEVKGADSAGIRFFADGSSTGGHVSLIQDHREWRVNVAWLTGDIALDEHPQ